jgi:metal-responsive CopG/Arc/MetJ family transcriptional regulator
MPSSNMRRKERRVRLQVILPDAIVAAIDDFRFATRARNRSEAVRHLLKVGQAAHTPGEPRLRRSKN